MSYATGHLLAVSGAARYEFGMQARRKAVWIVLPLFVLPDLAGGLGPWDQPEGASLAYVIADWAYVLQGFMPVAFGCLLADRLPRDRRTGAEEVLETLPAPPLGRLIGKYLGATLATALPIFLIYAAGIAYVLANRGDLLAVPLALAAFAAINLPGLLFVGAFSVAVPAIVWTPLYQFLFVGYWFWGNSLPGYVPVPSLTGTYLMPAGDYAFAGFFDTRSLYVLEASVWEGLLSVGLLLGLTAPAIFCAHLILRRQERL